MSLTLITGRANTGRSDVVLGEVRRALSEGRYPSLLLPTAPDAARAAAVLAREGLVGADVRQIGSWLADLWGLHGDGRTIVSRPQRLSAADVVAEGVGVRLVRASARRAGFPDLLAGIAARLAIETADWTGSLRPGSAVDAELVSLLVAYRRHLAETGLVEPGEAAHLLAGADIALQGPVIAHRLDDLDRSQEALLSALARTNDVYVTLTWERGFPATEVLDGLVSRLVASGARHAHRPKEPAPARGELDRLESALFGAPEPAPLRGQVRFCTATGPEAECALVAEQAAEAAAAFGPGRVAIVFRDPSSRAEALRSALSAAGVPAAMDIMVPALQTPLGRAVAVLLDAVSGPVDPSGLVSFLRTPFSGADAGAVDGLDARWRKQAPADVAGRLRQASRLGRLPARALRCARRLSGAGDTCDVRLWKHLADTMLRAAYPEDTFAQGPDAVIDGAVHAALVRTAVSLAAFGRPCSWADMRRSLERERVSSGEGERPGHVQVTEAHRLRSRRFDAVILGGLTAGDFSAEGRTSGAEEIAERLLAGDGPSRQARDRLLFYGVCTRARERLVLVRQTSDAEGTPRRPSVFWEEALDLYRPATPDLDNGHQDEPIAGSMRLSDLERVAPSFAPGRAAARLSASARAAAGSTDRETSRHAVEHGLCDSEVLAGLAARQEFSATELEKYARCPYRWFYERMVRPEGLDAAFGPMERGDIAHRVLATFYEQAPARLGSRRITRSLLPDALDLVEEVFTRVTGAPGAPVPRTLLERDQLARTRTEVLGLIATEPDFLVGFEPAHAELRFGTPRPGGSDPEAAHPGPVDLGGFLLRGSIDRVDEGEAGIVVVDYKSGSSVPKRADFDKDLVLQVPIYAAAARVLLGRPVVGGLYRSIRTGEARGFYLADAVPATGLTGTDLVAEAEGVAEILETALTVARRAADGIRAGRIAAEPATPHACDFCPAGTLCGGAA